MTMTTDLQFELQQVDGMEWIIRDHRYAAPDPHGTVASIWRLDDGECEVTWLVDFALPTRYVCPSNVISDLRRVVSRSTKPIPIPHFAPVGEPSADSSE
ncbi:hypothetical protein [Microbacterium sp. 22242]|uniref:hypothetical protein n=1 Tax=Microbacterium sp. 22242 TaxID=3453896 RepID=UPI003F85D9F2